MEIEPYRKVLALPGVRPLLLVGLLARIPVTAIGLTLTLHVVQSLGLSYTEAGIAGAAGTIGTAVGAPLAGRFVDRSGLRPVIAITMVVSVAFWVLAPALSYYALVILAFVAGLFSLPVFGIVRQSLAVIVPKDRHQTGFALDAIVTEMSFMAGPAVAAVGVATLSSGTMMYVIAVALGLSGCGLWLLNPATRSAVELAAGPAERVPRSQWLTPSLLALLGIGSVLTFVLTTTEFAVVATLNAAGATPWIGLVVGLWCFASLVGGFIYGGLSRGYSPVVLTALLSALTVPVALIGGGWWWLCLALIPSGVLCAPAMSATVDLVNRAVPAGARGLAMGLHGTAMTAGAAVASPVAGVIIDNLGPAWAFAIAGLIGLVIAAATVPLLRARSAAPVADSADAQGVPA